MSTMQGQTGQVNPGSNQAVGEGQKRVHHGRPEPARSGRTYVPPVDILEKDDELVLVADVPGARPESIDIDYERGELRIRARVEPRQQNVNCTLREYGVGDFVRVFELGDDLDAQKISAEVRDGVLILHLPKAEAARTRKISVKPG